MSKILVVGCLSLDTIHLDYTELEKAERRKTYNTIGGAGLFTAMAAAHEGAEVTLYAPKPNPIPEALLAVDKALKWIGPAVPPQNLPTLEIIHHGEDRATLVGASWGPEKQLTTEHLQTLLAQDSEQNGIFDAVHIAALSSPARQLQFFDYFSQAQNTKCISAGTYARAIGADKDTVQKLVSRCGLFFMNSNEASLLFGDSAVPVEKIS
jgi:sugar/nucleoside kinase (ribokinase family)